MSFTPRQHRQNAAFLRALARTGNARAAASALGVHRATYTRRRAKDAAFAARWDAALAFANAFLSSPLSSLRGARGGDPANLMEEFAAKRSRTPAAPHATRTSSGRLQLRRRPATAITDVAEQAFLAALSATANVRLSARAAGFA